MRKRNGTGGTRAVCVRLQHKRVGPVTGEQVNSLSYPGILLTAYEDGRQVGEHWVPVGDEPTEEDDEQLVQALHRALRWQERELSIWSG